MHPLVAQIAEQSSNPDSALIIATIAMFVSLIGIWNTNRVARRDRQLKLFAEAYAAVRSYREFPFAIRRRLTSDTEADLTTRLSSCQVEMDKYAGLLLVESSTVGTAYLILIEETRRVAGAEISAAWDAPPRALGEPPHVRNVDLLELALPDSAFLLAVRDHLSLFPTRLRRAFRHYRS